MTRNEIQVSNLVLWCGWEVGLERGASKVDKEVQEKLAGREQGGPRDMWYTF